MLGLGTEVTARNIVEEGPAGIGNRECDVVAERLFELLLSPLAIQILGCLNLVKEIGV